MSRRLVDRGGRSIEFWADRWRLVMALDRSDAYSATVPGRPRRVPRHACRGLGGSGRLRTSATIWRQRGLASPFPEATSLSSGAPAGDHHRRFGARRKPRPQESSHHMTRSLAQRQADKRPLGSRVHKRRSLTDEIRREDETFRSARSTSAASLSKLGIRPFVAAEFDVTSARPFPPKTSRPANTSGLSGRDRTCAIRL